MNKVNRNDLYDVVIVGGGPAGLTAALYLSRARYRVVVVEKEHFGGQITITHEIVNYPGVEKSGGKTLTDTIRRQAQNFGAEFILAEVTELVMEYDVKVVKTSRGELNCFGVLLATGAHPRKVGFKGEEEFRGRGVAYCATCDGEFFTGKDVFVIGGGFAAAEESVFLAKYARHVTVLIREDGFTCAPAVAEGALDHEKITVLTNVQVEEVTGKYGLKSIRYRNTITGEVTEYHAPSDETFGVFVFAGYEPATDLIRNIAKCNEYGYVITDKNQKTSQEGLYAAGDVCIKSLRQVVTAVGDGALAATELERYAARMHKKTGIHTQMPNISAENNTGKEQNVINNTKAEDFLTSEMTEQLKSLFQKMTEPLLLKLYLDQTPQSSELEGYMQELCKLTDKLELKKTAEDTERKPYVQVCKKDGAWSGLSFHGVPGGHEFTSFLLGLYNVSGPGQKLENEIMPVIKELPSADMKIFVSLSCTMCPELVTSAQHIAAINPHITAEVYDLNHFHDLRDQYQVMSVPCLVINDGEKVIFGKKNIRELVEILSE